MRKNIRCPWILLSAVLVVTFSLASEMMLLAQTASPASLIPEEALQEHSFQLTVPVAFALPEANSGTSEVEAALAKREVHTEEQWQTSAIARYLASISAPTSSTMRVFKRDTAPPLTYIIPPGVLLNARAQHDSKLAVHHHTGTPRTTPATNENCLSASQLETQIALGKRCSNAVAAGEKPDTIAGRAKGNFNWQNALLQSLAFLGMQHGFRLVTEGGTRADLRGPFWKDYTNSVKGLAGWRDGDPFVVNYIGHPMMGSVTGFIQIQNDRRGIQQTFGRSKEYWNSRLKAFGWSVLYSTQFELGLISEATIGNVGIRPYDGRKHPMAYVDLVVTPVMGTVWLVGEDTLDKYLIRYLDRKINNKTVRVIVRGILNPTRSLANFLRGQYPWHREDRTLEGLPRTSAP